MFKEGVQCIAIVSFQFISNGTSTTTTTTSRESKNNRSRMIEQQYNHHHINKLIGDEDDGWLGIVQEKLKCKLSGRKFHSESKNSSCTREEEGFSLKFKWETTIGLTGKQSRENGQFDAPMDVKIDERRGWILVCDCGNRRVSVFDSYTKEFKFNIETNSTHPCTIQIVDECDGLLIGCDDGQVLMYDLENSKFKWKSSDDHVTIHNLEDYNFRWKRNSRDDVYLGTIYVNTEMGHVYVGDFNEGGVRVLDLKSGQDIKGYTLNNTYWTRFAVGAYGMDRLIDGRMVISHFLKNYVTLISDIHGSLPFKLKSSFNGPRGVCVDKVNGNILVCDEGNDKIHIFDKDGRLIREFGEYGPCVFSGFSGLFSCAINYVSGELIVADTNNYRIQIFK